MQLLIVANVLDCSLEESVFKLESCYYIHLQTNTHVKGMNSIIPPAMDQIVSLLSFYKDGSDIKWPSKVDMPFNEEAKWLLLSTNRYSKLYNWKQFIIID